MKVSKEDSLSFFLNNPILLAFLISLETEFLKNGLRNITDFKEFELANRFYSTFLNSFHVAYVPYSDIRSLFEYANDGKYRLNYEIKEDWEVLSFLRIKALHWPKIGQVNIAL